MAVSAQRHKSLWCPQRKHLARLSKPLRTQIMGTAMTIPPLKSEENCRTARGATVVEEEAEEEVVEEAEEVVEEGEEAFEQKKK